MDSLLQKDISRLSVLKFQSNHPIIKNVNISIYRNHSFEHMEGVISKFLNSVGISASFHYSDYDDSFNFYSLTEKNDINIIWIDFSRYKNIDVVAWFNDRIKLLKSLSKKPIFVYYTGLGNLPIYEQDVVIANSNSIEKELGALFYDKDKFEYSGTNLSSKASMRIAQEIGLKYLPSFFMTPIKAVVIDMDNTFYKGIVGEDGIDSIVPNIEFQNKLKEFKDRGVLLAIASKNERNDLEELFEKRKDFVLKWNDFSSHNISWESKDKAILNVAKEFNIGLDSILFIDDNIGEISLIQSCYPQVNTLIADNDLAFKFSIYPLLERYTISKEDSLRANDIEANQIRNQLLASLDKDEYFKSLEMVLTYSIDNDGNLERAIQLLNKTNQFIFSYKRYAKEDISDKQHILTISLKDKLSDSGIIGIIVAENKNDILVIDELVVSCRALGRNIEDIMLDNAFGYLADKLHTSNDILVEFKLGPRNKPAQTWLENYSNTVIDRDELVSCNIKRINNSNICMEFI